ncbi:MAG: succinylglutamate desuccinylase/aspartoacylase family protein [Alphaproteobacteria bacterium]|nr:succinylglutamate desuccinylase/aspartoacylase family protein [Alphaproteobacteria bacterium]
MLVEVTHDGLGFPVRLPVMVMRGAKAGPVLGLTAALHGNELNGLPVIHGLMRSLHPRQLRGDLVAVVAANPPGVVMRQRRFSDDSDLNHVMPGRPDGTGAQVFAHRIIRRVIRHFDLLVDLHTASFGRVNCLYIRADMTRPAIAQMAYLQRPQIIVHNPPNDLTLRGTAQELGIPAITLEIGDPHRFQRSYIRRSQAGLRAVMAAAGMIRTRPIDMGAEPVLCESSGWFYTDRGGLLEVLPAVTDAVEEGEVVARQRSMFGELIREYTAPWSGVVIGKAVDPVAETGARVMHLGRLAPEDHPFQRRDLDTLYRLAEED